VVVQAAVPATEIVTAEQPLIAVVFEVNPTVPVGTGGPAGVTAAVKVTDFPTSDGFWLEVTVVVEVAMVPPTLTEALPLEEASFAPSPLKQPITLCVPMPPSCVAVTPASDAVALQLVVQPDAGTSAEVPSAVPEQEVPV
jgi:hypothetical protein